jgi:hypothetical protein
MKTPARPVTRVRRRWPGRRQPATIRAPSRDNPVGARCMIRQSNITAWRPSPVPALQPPVARLLDVRQPFRQVDRHRITAPLLDDRVGEVAGHPVQVGRCLCSLFEPCAISRVSERTNTPPYQWEQDVPDATLANEPLTRVRHPLPGYYRSPPQ